MAAEVVGKTPAQDLNDIQAGYAKKKRALIAENEQKLRQVESDYKTQEVSENQTGEAAVNHIREKNASETNALRDQHKKSYASAQTQNVNELQAERKTGEDQVKTVTDKYHREYQKQKESGEMRVQEVEKNSSNQLKNITDENEVRETKLRTQYAKDIDDTSRLGESKKTQAATQNKIDLTHIEAEHKKHLETEQKQYNSRLNELSKNQSQALQTQKDLETKALTDQKKNFDESYQKLDKADNQSFALQRQKTDEAFDKLKGDLAVKSSGVLQKREDEFYKIDPSRAKIEETADAYIVRVEIPEHERDHVKIRVDDHKASVIGTREFQENVKEENRKLSASSFQTYREEFKFDKPVRASAIERRDLPGLIEVHIPKIRTFG